jgi:hypothetical protein
VVGDQAERVAKAELKPAVVPPVLAAGKLASTALRSYEGEPLRGDCRRQFARTSVEDGSWLHARSAQRSASAAARSAVRCMLLLGSVLRSVCGRQLLAQQIDDRFQVSGSEVHVSCRR